METRCVKETTSRPNSRGSLSGLQHSDNFPQLEACLNCHHGSRKANPKKKFRSCPSRCTVQETLRNMRWRKTLTFIFVVRMSCFIWTSTVVPPTFQRLHV